MEKNRAKKKIGLKRSLRIGVVKNQDQDSVENKAKHFGIQSLVE